MTSEALSSLHTDDKEEQMNIAEYLKDDWLYRLPYRLDNMKFKGSSRPAYTILCLIYYSAKSLLILIFAGLFYVYKFFLWDLWKWLFNFESRAWYQRMFYREYDDYEEDDYEEDDNCEDESEPDNETVDEDNIEDIQFCQLFRIGDHMCLLIDHIEMCPDETAFIRVVDDEGYTPLYKRKVRRDKNNNRFIVFNSTNHYLDDSKTQPAIRKDK